MIGAWTPEEEELLAIAVNQIRGEDWNGGDSELPDTASWTDVAHYVKTRTATQCWNKWLDRIANQRERELCCTAGFMDCLGKRMALVSEISGQYQVMLH